MNAERAKRREEIAARMMATLNGPMGPGEGYSDYGAMARDAVRMANALMDALDAAALADMPDADPLRQLAALKQRAEGGDDRDIVIEANAIQIAALNGIVKVREDQVADLERKLAALNEFVEGVLNEASKSPELYGPFVRLVQDLDAKVGAK